MQDDQTAVAPAQGDLLAELRALGQRLAPVQDYQALGERHGVDLSGLVGEMLVGDMRRLVAEQAPPERFRELGDQWGVSLAETAFRLGEMTPIGFWEAFRDKPLEKIPFAGTAFTVTDLADLRAAAVRMSEGEDSDEDRELVFGHLESMARADEGGFGYWAGMLSSELPGFALEFAATMGVAGAAKGALKETTKRLLGRTVAEGAERTSIRAAAGAGARAALSGTPTAGSMIGYSAAATAISPTTLEETYRAMLPEMGIAEDEGQRLAVVMPGTQREFWEALVKEGAPRSFIEHFSEQTGWLLSKAPPISVIRRMQNAVMVKWLGMAPGRTAGDFMARVATGTRWDGALEEVGEEFVGGALRAAVGLDPWSEVFDMATDGEQLSAMLATFSVPGAAASLARGVGGRLTPEQAQAVVQREILREIERQEQAQPVEEMGPSAEEVDREPGAAPPQEGVSHPGPDLPTPEAPSAGMQVREPTPEEAPTLELVRRRLAAAQLQDEPRVVEPTSPEELRARGVVETRGANVLLVDVGEGSPFQGMYDVGAGTVVLNAREAQNPVLWTAMAVHELTHHLEAVSEGEWGELYAEIARIDPDGLARSREGYMADAAAAGFSVAASSAQGEAVGRYVENVAGYVHALMAEPGKVRRLLERPEAQGLLQRLLEAIRRALGALGVRLPRNEARALAQLQRELAVTPFERAGDPARLLEAARAIESAMTLMLDRASPAESDSQGETTPEEEPATEPEDSPESQQSESEPPSGGGELSLDEEVGDLETERAEEELAAEEAEPTGEDGGGGEAPSDFGTAEAPDVQALGRALEEPLLGEGFKTITQARKWVQERAGFAVTGRALDEALELASVLASRGIVQAARNRGSVSNTADWVFDQLVALYNRTPKLGARTSTSRMRQQYSTPPPLAWVASQLARAHEGERVFEPTAGNGALLIDVDPASAAANEIDDTRRTSLEAQGFEPTDWDASGAMIVSGVDRVVTNPPFGRLRNEDGKAEQRPITMPTGAPGFKTSDLAHHIVFRALAQLESDGRAVFIIGSKHSMSKGDKDADRAKQYRGRMDLAFWRNLFEQWNVTDHFTVAGKLYDRQGAAWPVDVVVIDGRNEGGELSHPLPSASLPRVLESWDEVKELLDGENSLGPRGGGQSGRGGGARKQRGSTEGAVPGPAQEPAPEASGPGGEGASGGDRAGQPDDGGGGSPGFRAPGAVGQAPPGERRGVGAGERGGPAGVAGARPADAGGVEGAAEPGGAAPQGELTDADIDAAVQRAVDAELGEEAPAPPSDLDLIADELDELRGLLSVRPRPEGFDEAKYRELTPVFLRIKAKLDLPTPETGDEVVELVQGLVQTLERAGGYHPEQIRNSIPFFAEFAKDLRDGVLGERKPEPAPAPAPDAPEASAHQAAYQQKSRVGRSVGTLLPANQAHAVQRAFERVERETGLTVDEFVADRLGYSMEELPGYFSAEQIDALALAVFNIEQGRAFIIADQTGVGKGRVVAGLMVYALREGKVPFFVSRAPGLFVDIYRDLADIGHPEFRGLPTNAGLTGKDALDVTHEAYPPGFKVRSVPKSKYKDTLATLRRGELPEGYNGVFSTYDQLSPGTGDERRVAVEGIMGNSILILDESHNAGGGEGDKGKVKEGKIPRSVWFRGMVGKASGVAYSSATFAKNPYVMTLYHRTDLGASVEKVDSLVEMMQRGGVPLQQVISSMLAESGQLLRREKSYEGISFPVVELPVQEEQAEAQSALLRELFHLDLQMDEARGAFAAHLNNTEGVGVGQDAGVGGSAVNRTNFASVMFNLVSQAMLALKVDQAAARAVEAWDQGRGVKPIIGLSNTMGSFMADFMADAGYENGDQVEGFHFGLLFDRYLERMRRVGIVNDEGQVHDYRRISDEDLVVIGHGSLVAAFERAKSTVAGASGISSLPASPIDALRRRLEEAGMKVGELTGRSVRLALTSDVDGVVESRDTGDAPKKRAMQAFNDGEFDALIVNRSAATGYSLHASPREGKDVRPRRMYVVQAEPNVDDFMQLLGRINRTGQVAMPSYELLYADVAVERRAASVLSRHIASLNANTTAGREGGVSVDAVDFINEHGDRVVAEVLWDAPAFALALNVERHKPDKAPDGWARYVTGRANLLPPRQQEDLFDRIDENYLAYMETLRGLGESVERAEVLEVSARTLNAVELAPAKEGGTSPFYQPATLELIEAQRTVTPPSVADSQAAARANLGIDADANLARAAEERSLSLIEFAQKNIDDQRKEIEDASSEAKKALGQAEQAFELAKSKLDAAKEKAKERGLKAKERKEFLEGPNDFYKEAKEAKDAAERRFRRAQLDGDALTENTQLIVDTLRLAPVGEVVEVQAQIDPEDPKSLGEPQLAMVLDAKRLARTQSPLALSDWQLTLQGTESESPMRVPFSKLAARTVHLKAASRAEYEAAIDRGERTLSERRQMVTGNLVAGFEKSLARGQVSFIRMQDGQTRQAILMPRNFDLVGALQAQPVAMKPDQAAEFLRRAPLGAQIVDGGGMLQLERVDGNNHMLRVAPGARRFIENPRVVGLLGEMESRRGQRRTIDRRLSVPKSEELLELWASLGGEWVARDELDLAREITGEQLPDAPLSIRSDAFRRWFANSSVVDESGQPLVVYHETRHPGAFTEFIPGGLPVRGRLLSGPGSWFKADPERVYSAHQQGKRASTLPVYLSLQRPFVVHRRGSRERAQSEFPALDIEGFTQEERAAVEAAGYDGLVALDGHGQGEQFVAFYPSQIKSAISNRGTYDPGLADIRLSVRSDEFRRWFGDSKVVDYRGEPAVWYHGTNAEPFTDFHPVAFFGAAATANTYADPYPLDAYDAEIANQDLDDGYPHTVEARARVYPVYLSVQRPAPDSVVRRHMRATLPEEYHDDEPAHALNLGRLAAPLVRSLQSDGYDGYYTNADGRMDEWERDVGIESWAVFSPTQIKSAIGNRGTYDPGLPDIRLSVAPSDGLYAIEPPTRLDLARVRFQDYFLRVRRHTEAIKGAGFDVQDTSNPYLQEELFSGRTEAELEQLMAELVQPLTGFLERSGISLDDAGEFVYAMHAEERNDVILGRNKRYDPEANPGSGMRSSTARGILRRRLGGEQAADYNRLARLVRRINERRLEILEEAGLITEETAATWRSTYNHYVPLRHDVEGRPAARMGQGFDIRGPESFRARGRGGDNMADNPIYFSVLQLREAVVRAQKNRVGLAMLKLAREVPDETQWEVTEGRSGKARVDKDGAIRAQWDKRYDLGEMTISVKEEGKEHLITFVDRGLARAFKRLDYQAGNFLTRTLGRFNRVLVMMNTALDIEFALGNLSRDLQTAGIHLTGEQSKQFAINVMKGSARAFKAFLRDAKDPLSTDELAMEARRWRLAGGKVGFYQSLGIDEIARDLEKAVNRVNRSTPEQVRDALFGEKGLMSLVLRMNGAAENMLRLSAFNEALRVGMTEDQAASLSKNLTVNFTRKGEWGQAMNALWLFYNAGVQGNVRMVQALVRSKVVRALAMLGAGMGFAFAQFARFMAGDDPRDGLNWYDKIPDHVKERNFIFMWPGEDGRYSKLPLPYGYHIFTSIGRAVSDALPEALGGAGESPMAAAANVATTAVNAFNPLGQEAGLQLVSPTALDLPVQLATNETFFGGDIRPEPLGFGPEEPRSERYWPSVSPVLREVTSWVNEQTGGDEWEPGAVDVSPEDLEHTIGFFTGGVGRLLLRSWKLAEWGAGRGNEPRLQDIPFLRRLAGEVDDSPIRREFREVRDEFERVDQRVNALRRRGELQAAREAIRDAGPLWALRGRLDATLKAIKSLRDRSATAEMGQRVQLEQRMADLMGAFTREYREVAAQ